MPARARFVACLVLALVGCTPSGTTPTDTDVHDGGTDAWHLVDANRMDAGPPERRTYVVSSFVVPTRNAQLADVAIDLDGDAAPDDAIGHLLIALAQQGVDLGAVANANVDDGAVITLIDARAPSFVNGTLAGYLLEGGDPMPAPCTMPADPTTCRQHLAGTGHFSVVPPVPNLFGGAVAESSLRLAGSSGLVPLPFFAAPIWVPASRIDVRADVDASGLMHGVLACAIRDTDVQTMVMPALHDQIVALVARDCPTSTTCTPNSTGATLLSVFDADTDGTITLMEVSTNGLLLSVLHPDLDVFDAMGAPGTDGTLDSLSLGLGFTAVLATFDAP